MTDEQFERFLAAFERRIDDHDLLTEIKTIVKLNHESYLNFRDETSTKIATLSKQVSSAHKRVDYVMVGGILSILVAIVSMAGIFFKMMNGG